MSCEQCATHIRELVELRAENATLKADCTHLQGVVDRIEELIVGAPVVGSRPRSRARRSRIVAPRTPMGNLISGVARARGIDLAALSEQLGHSRDYLARLTRGMRLTAPAAVSVGAALGIDLSDYVGTHGERRTVSLPGPSAVDCSASPEPPSAKEPPAPSLPFAEPAAAVPQEGAA